MEEYLDGSMSLEDVFALENLERLEGFSELDSREGELLDLETENVDEEEEEEDEEIESEEDEEWY